MPSYCEIEQYWLFALGAYLNSNGALVRHDYPCETLTQCWILLFDVLQFPARLCLPEYINMIKR